MKLAVDVMGFENEIKEATKACIQFQKDHHVEIVLVGDETKIKASLTPEQAKLFSIVHATEVIEQTDDISIIRSKKDSSMLKAIQLVANNHADGVLSAGNSAVYVFLTYQQFGLIPGVSKPAFMPFIPSFKGHGFNVIDVGASADCAALDLYQFAMMGHIYTSCRGLDHPRIGVLNIGTEDHKGLAWHAELNTMLKNNSMLNYIGFVEAKDLLNGVCDVLITDGYTGNVLLKTLEGALRIVFKSIVDYYKTPWTAWTFMFSAPMLLKMRKKYDYKNHAGAFVLGLNKMAVKTHGSADYKQFYSALRMLKESLDYKILDKIKQVMEHEFSKMTK